MDADNKVLNFVNNCNGMLKDVFIPLITADLQYLIEVYMNYRKQQLLTI